MIFGLGPPWAWALGAAPIGPGVAALWECRRQFTLVFERRPPMVAAPIDPLWDALLWAALLIRCGVGGMGEAAKCAAARHSPALTAC